jgi:hypothetical protein
LLRLDFSVEIASRKSVVMCHEHGLPDYFLWHDRERKKEVHDGGKIMREPALHMPGRTREGILFV